MGDLALLVSQRSDLNAASSNHYQSLPHLAVNSGCDSILENCVHCLCIMEETKKKGRKRHRLHRLTTLAVLIRG